MIGKVYEESSEINAVEQAAQSPEQNDPDDEKERKRRLKGSLIKFGSIIVFAFIVFIFATLSWFASNTSVSGDGMGVSIANDNYQIVPLTTDTANNPGLASIFEQYHIGDSKSSDALVWNMTSLSNMDNYDANDDGIGPGSYGELAFYVKPRDTSIDLDLRFSIKGYAYTPETTNAGGETTAQEAMTPVSAELNGYLAGHIFLFRNRTIVYKQENGHDTDTISKIIYSDPILQEPVAEGETDTAPLEKVIQAETFTKANENTPVTIYWVWPRTLSTLVYAADNDSVSIEPFCYWDPNDPNPANANDDTYAKIKGNITNYPTHYLYDYTPAEGVTWTADSINSNNYDEYGSKYDKADNEIGKNVSYITLKMTTNEAAASASP